MSEIRVHVNLSERSYDILVGPELLSSAGERVAEWLAARFGKSATPSAVVVTDGNVAQHAQAVQESLEQAGWRVGRINMQPGEQSKRLEVISSAYDELVQFRTDRQTVIVAVGGGVVGDAAGFIAATFNRGLPFVQVPTTLLADVDSSVGGKVGVNHPQAKNLIGAFHQPLGVIIDTHALRTLPEREFRSGLAEVAKYGVILDAEFFTFLEQNVDAINAREDGVLAEIIARCCQLKADVVEHDEYERTGLRAVLNYGHTFAHAFEALAGYGELLHGEAVSIGMEYAALLSLRLGRIDAEFCARQTNLLKALGLPVALNLANPISGDEVIERMLLDKKSVGGTLRFILPTRMGHVELVSDIPVDEVRKVMQELGIS